MGCCCGDSGTWPIASLMLHWWRALISRYAYCSLFHLTFTGERRIDLIYMFPQENEAGVRVRELWHQEWSTNVTVHPTSNDPEDLIIRSFHGTYNLTVHHQGQVIKNIEFYLPQGEDILIDIEV